MKLLIVSTAPFIYMEKDVYSYGPYVNELMIWNKNASTIAFCCPVWEADRGLLISKVPFEIKKHFKLIDLNGLSFKAKMQSFFLSFYNIMLLFKGFYWADHIHIRCPGNLGLLGCFVQIFFPNTPKTAKYAGNWDPESKQPRSYRLQKWILSNTFLTRKMQVLIYGEWPNQSKNIKAFFTASYYEEEKESLIVKNLESKISFVFVGSLVKGKNPMYAIQIVEGLFSRGFDVSLNIYGEGIERNNLERYISENNLAEVISLKGNQDKGTLKTAYLKSHFVLLPSESEGWPKAIAEGMFWGCVPIATSVSCVPFMLDYGNRGVLLDRNLNSDVMQIASLLTTNNNDFIIKQKKAFEWSQAYTLDVFESEIKKLMV
jgi:glycosyltransferase involved in cell wall biosynthesis